MKTLILVDYKSPERTLNYIGDFISIASTEDFHFLVVDNSATECWKQYCLNMGFAICDCMLREAYTENCKAIWTITFSKHTVYIVEAKENLGYGKGNNLGVLISQRLWEDNRILISNNDLEFPEGIDFDVYEDVFRKYPDVAAIGPMIKTPRGAQQNPHKYESIKNVLTKKYFYFLFCPNKLKNISDVILTSKNGYAYWIMGCFMYIDAEKFIESGMFDESTFLYCEEKILSERLAKNGYKMFFLADQIVIHNHGQTIKSTMSSINAAKIGFASQIYYFTHYKKVSKVDLALAYLSFELYKLLFPIKQKIKGLRTIQIE